jgi:molybdopterin-binding protein/molybdate transport repressor ModE-like protein
VAAEPWLTPTDRALLAALRRTPNLVRAARSIGISRDRGVYRLSRLAHLYGGPVARGERGGREAGATRLTALGERLLEPTATRGLSPNRFRGEYRLGPPPNVRVAGGGALEVTFSGRDGEQLDVEVDPAAIVVGLRPLDSSARNVLPVVISAVRPRGRLTTEVRGTWHGLTVKVVVTPRSVERMRLAPGRPAYLHVKAPAVRRVPS